MSEIAASKKAAEDEGKSYKHPQNRENGQTRSVSLHHLPHPCTPANHLPWLFTIILIPMNSLRGIAANEANGEETVAFSGRE